MEEILKQYGGTIIAAVVVFGLLGIAVLIVSKTGFLGTAFCNLMSQMTTQANNALSGI